MNFVKHFQIQMKVYCIVWPGTRWHHNCCLFSNSCCTYQNLPNL